MTFGPPSFLLLADEDFPPNFSVQDDQLFMDGESRLYL